MQLVKMATHQSGVAEAQVQVVMEVAEEVEQGGALTMVVHGALRVVVAVSAGKLQGTILMKHCQTETKQTIDTRSMCLVLH
jgi:hypothetical protein